MSDRRVLWLVPLFLLLHNAEEALFFPRYLPFVLARLPATWRTVAGPVTSGQVWLALAIVTLVGLGLTVWAQRHPESRTALWLVLLLQTTVLLNVLWHAAAAVVLFRGYAPGLVTALVLNLPFSVYLIRHAVRERWVGRGPLLALAPAALLAHGPMLSALLLATERWR
jgi:hypothetical protein